MNNLLNIWTVIGLFESLFLLNHLEGLLFVYITIGLVQISRCFPILEYLLSNISNTRNSVSSGYPNTGKRAENMTCSGVFLTKSEVFG